MSETSKPTNPKDAIGCNKLPMSLVPSSTMAYLSLAHLNGALKYGLWNWRAAGVRSSIYLDACFRHLKSWQEGEELDPEDGVPHLAAALACISIIVDAKECNKLVDDRPPSTPLAETIRHMADNVRQLKEHHKDRDPKHWTIGE